MVGRDNRKTKNRTMSTSTSQDESESVSKLSARLLAGWTMLSETCPRRGCSLPLMRSRSKDEVRRSARRVAPSRECRVG